MSGPHPVARYDLDGDGRLEVELSFRGHAQLFRSDGTLIGEAGCYDG